jgi:iron-sulfur cluster assembly accessory protein
MIDVTPLAAQKLEEILKDQDEEASMLRVMVNADPQSGIQYMLGVEKEAQDEDFIIQTDTIQVLIDPDSAPLIEGSQIDYVESIMRSGFVISNPNMQGGCGCGGGGCGCGAGGGGCGCGGGGCGGH